MSNHEDRLYGVLALTVLALVLAGGVLFAVKLTYADATLPEWLVTSGMVAAAAAMLGIALIFNTGIHMFNQMALQEEQLRVVVETAVDGFVTTDEFGVVESVNVAAERMFGIRASEICGARITMLLPLEDTVAQGMHFLEFLIENDIAVGKVNHVEGLRKDGKRFPMDLSVSCADLEPGPLLTFICRDVTDREEAHRALRRAHTILEDRVRERTTDLRRANRRLKKEIAQREKSETERQKLVDELQEAIARIKVLSGLIPICANCKKVRDDQGFWSQIETYVKNRSYANFSHGICPDCMVKLYPEFAHKTNEKEKTEEDNG